MKAPLPAWLWLVPFAVIFTAFQLAPMAWVVISAFNVNGDWGLGHFQEIAQSAFFRQAIWKSLTISLVSSAIGLVIATLTCHALVRSGGRLRRAMIAFTNMTSNFAGVPLAFAFIILLGANGVLTLALQRLGIIEDVRLYSTGGLIVIYTWFQIPLGILVVVGELHDQEAEIAHHLDHVDIVLDGRAVLGAEKDPDAPRGLGPGDIAGPAHRHDQVRMGLEAAVPLAQARQRLAGGLVVDQGGVDGVQAAFAHLLEDFPRPVGVLQAVDGQHFSGHDVSPQALT